jgi:hypothetical protein
MTIHKLVFNPGNYEVGIEYDHQGRSFRIQADDKPRDGLMLAASRVGAMALKVYDLPQGLRFSIKSISFSQGEEPGTVVVLEGSHAKLSMEKIEDKEVEKYVKDEHGGHREFDTDHPQNIFNDEVKNLKDEIIHYIKGQRQQLTFEFEKEQSTNLLDEGIMIDHLSEKDLETHRERVRAHLRREGSVPA